MSIDERILAFQKFIKEAERYGINPTIDDDNVWYEITDKGKARAITRR